MADSPFFSVIVPAFNRTDLLRQALQSVFRQDFRDFEVIVVDDGSTEDLSALIEEYRDRVTFLRQVNCGPGAARNRGAAASRGEYLALLDSDDVWFPWTLAVFFQIIQQHQFPSIVSGRLFAFTDPNQLAGVCKQELQAKAYPDYFAASSSGYNVGACTSVLRRSEFARIDGFVTESINAEDHDLIMRMGTAPGFVKLDQPFSVGYRRAAGGVSGNFRKTCEGARYLVRQESRGAYPGGQARSRERGGILARHLRPVTLECLRLGLRRDAWEIYWASFVWNLGDGRWRFLTFIPAVIFAQSLRNVWSYWLGRRRMQKSVQKHLHI